MSQDRPFRVDPNALEMTVAVTGRVDDKVAVELGSILDDVLAVAPAATVRLDHADLSLLGWAVIERAGRVAADRGVHLRIEPDPGLGAPERRMARAWLDALERMGDVADPEDER